MKPLGIEIWKWLARSRIGLPSRPIFGRRGQTKVGVSERGGDPEPNPRPRPLTGRMVPPVAPLPPELPTKAVAPATWPGGGMPGGPRGEVSELERMPPTGGPPIGPAPDPGGAPDGIMGPSPPKPKVLVPPRPCCCWGGGPTGPGPPAGWPTGYIPYWWDTFGSFLGPSMKKSAKRLKKHMR